MTSKDLTKIKDGAFAMIFCGNKILLFHRDNIPTIPNPDCWHLPGGGIEEGETSLETLKRELKEEISYIPQNIFFVKKTQRTENINFLYTAFVNDEEAKLFKLGPGEGQEIKFFTIDEALKLKLTTILRTRITKYRNEIEEAMKNKTVPKINL